MPGRNFAVFPIPCAAPISRRRGGPDRPHRTTRMLLVRSRNGAHAFLHRAILDRGDIFQSAEIQMLLPLAIHEKIVARIGGESEFSQPVVGIGQKAAGRNAAIPAFMFGLLVGVPCAEVRLPNHGMLVVERHPDFIPILSAVGRERWCRTAA